MDSELPQDLKSVLCEVLDSKNKPLCAIPLAQALHQRLRHRWIATVPTDHFRVLFKVGSQLALPFLRPLPIGASSVELAMFMLTPLRLTVGRVAALNTVALDDGRILELFTATVDAKSLSALDGSGLEVVQIRDLRFLAERDLLNPLAELLTDINL